jgi:hypothetical protein
MSGVTTQDVQKPHQEAPNNLTCSCIRGILNWLTREDTQKGDYPLSGTPHIPMTLQGKPETQWEVLTLG